MRSDRLPYARTLAGVPASFRYRACGDVLSGKVAWKEPVARFFHSPPSAQDLQQCLRQHYITISSALALIDTDYHPLAVDVSGLQTYSLGDPQTRGIARCKNGAVLGAGDATEKMQYLSGAQHYWQFLR